MSPLSSTIAVLVTALALSASADPLEIIAHRGVHQRIRRQQSIAPWACTADLILPADHAQVENTLASIRAAFAAGATAVEIDVHATVDGGVVVFHDWTLDCRTDGSGVTEQQSLSRLLALDVGHGYTRDQGRTFPFRDRGLRMPTLRQVLDAFPEGRLLVNMKSGNPEALETIVAVLADFPDRDLVFFCGKTPFNLAVRDRLPWIRVPKLDRAGIKRCLRALALPFGRVPDECRDAELMLPWERLQKLGPLAAALIESIHEVGSKLYAWGVDDAEAARCAARMGVDGVMTDRIELVGPALGSVVTPTGEGG